MKTILMVAFAVLSLAACTPSDNDISLYNNIVNANSDKICLDGVMYHKVRGYKMLGVAVAYNTDGTIKLCEVE